MPKLLRIAILLFTLAWLCTPSQAQPYLTPGGLPVSLEVYALEGVEGERLLVRPDDNSSMQKEFLCSQRIQRASGVANLPKGTRIGVVSTAGDGGRERRVHDLFPFALEPAKEFVDHELTLTPPAYHWVAREKNPENYPAIFRQYDFGKDSEGANSQAVASIFLWCFDMSTSAWNDYRSKNPQVPATRTETIVVGGTQQTLEISDSVAFARLYYDHGKYRHTFLLSSNPKAFPSLLTYFRFFVEAQKR